MTGPYIKTNKISTLPQTTSSLGSTTREVSASVRDTGGLTLGQCALPLHCSLRRVLQSLLEVSAGFLVEVKVLFQLLDLVFVFV